MNKKHIALFAILIVIGASLATSAVAYSWSEFGKDFFAAGRLSFIKNGGSSAHPGENDVMGFLRILEVLLVTTILFILLSRLGGGAGILGPGGSFLISFLIAIVTALFTPGSLLLAWAASYSIIVISVFFGGPILGALWLCFGVLPNTRGWAFAKAFILLFVGIIIVTVVQWASGYMVPGIRVI